MAKTRGSQPTGITTTTTSLATRSAALLLQSPAAFFCCCFLGFILLTSPAIASPAPSSKGNASVDQRLYLGVLHSGSVEGIEKVVERALSSAGPLPVQLTPLYLTRPPQPKQQASLPQEQSQGPVGFGASQLRYLCSRLEGKYMATFLVLTKNGPEVDARLAAAVSNIPLLWSSNSPFQQEKLGRDEVRLDSGVNEAAWALRSLLVTSHWHSYTLLESEDLLAWGTVFSGVLNQPPLQAKRVPLPKGRPKKIHRVLTWLSQSGRGVIAVATDSQGLEEVMREAKSLNMVSGDFVWVWLDTGPGSITPAQCRTTRSTEPRKAREVAATPSAVNLTLPRLPIGLLAVRRSETISARAERLVVRGTVRLAADAVRRAAETTAHRLHLDMVSFRQMKGPASCWNPPQPSFFTNQIIKELRRGARETLEGRMYESNESSGKTLAARFQILNLVPEGFSPSMTIKQLQQTTASKAVQESTTWRNVGEIVGCCDVKLERIVWPGGNIGGPCGGARTVLNVATAVAAPFVMHSDLPISKDGKKNCLRGIPCNIIREYNGTRYAQTTSCCYGLAIDLLDAVAKELEFDYHLYTVPDAMFGSRVVNPDTGAVRWSGIVGDLMNGHAHLAFTALSVTRPRSEVIDFSTPFYFSTVSFLAAPNTKMDIPLLAFLLPFSPELWIAIFTSLNVTAVAVAIYEWLSPFGLNPWGRQRTKNFSMSSALWVCWGLLCGHLVAFKAPKSWPNKFLINVWGGFSVIFVASYTANIAALIAGLFFHSATATYHSEALLWQRVAAPKGSSAEYYVYKANQLLWDHMQRYQVPDVEAGVHLLRNGTLDFLIADTPILDYYRATDQGCKLQKIGDTITEDAYAIGMTKGFPLKDSISAVIAKFSSNGYMDILQEKWYGGLACFKADMDVSQPKPLGVTAVAGVFLLLGMGMIMGLLILLVEHLFYRYTLPILRHKPKGTIWKSRNIMFFSQKLYRFINCVELVSPHHAARELVHTIRQGQITSLFQKSVKREHEQRRRRKSKAQFFEMIQEIRRVQQEEKQASVRGDGRPSPRGGKLPRLKSPNLLSPSQDRRMSKLPGRLELARRFSKDVFRSKSSGNLSLRRMSSDINFAANRFFDCHSSQAIGRRLSRDTNLSPPDINSRRASNLLSVDSCDISHRHSSNELDSRFQPPEISVHPPVSSATLPAKKFSYVDVQSSTFRDRVSRLGEQPELTTFKERPENKVIVHREERPRIVSTMSVDSHRKENDSAHREKKFKAAASLDTASERVVEERRRNTPTLMEQIATMQEQFPAKPKIVSCVPKRCKPESLHFPKVEGSSMRPTEEGERSPLDRLSKDELVKLCNIPENELKRRLVQAIKEKHAT